MDAVSGAEEVLSTRECWLLLDRNEVGRLAVVTGGEPDIHPIHYFADGQSIVFKSTRGFRFAATLATEPPVAFEIDGYEPERGETWNVVVRGVATVIPPILHIFASKQLPAFPWVEESPATFLRIVPSSVRGRRYTVSTVDATTDPTADDGASVRLRT